MIDISYNEKMFSTTTKTLLVLISRSFNLVVSSLLSLIVVRFILSYIGSDYNGLNAVLTQVLTIFILVENSFSFASRVALFKPYVSKDFNLTNDILSTTSKVFSKIGIYALISGTLFSIVFATLLKTDIDFLTIVSIFMLTLFSIIFNTIFISKYTVLFHVSQTEYILNFVQMIFSIISQLVAMLIIVFTQNIILLRLQYTLFSVLTGLVIKYIAKKIFSSVNYRANIDYSLIKGTKDVLISTTTGMVYKSAAIFFISSFGGTLLVSVYAVYNAVISVMERLIYSIIESPQNALGQIISHNDKNKSYTYFKQYEQITIMLAAILLPTTFSLIFSFVKLYTIGVDDVNYYNFFIGFLLILNASIQFIHIPSGNSINLSGHFWITRRIQITALIILLTLMTLGGLLFNLYGILLANTITGLFLLFVEVYYSRKYVFNKKLYDFFIFLIPNIILGFILGLIGQIISTNVSSWITFIVIGFLLTSINSLVVVITNRLLFPNDMKVILNRFNAIIMRVTPRIRSKK